MQRQKQKQQWLLPPHHIRTPHSAAMVAQIPLFIWAPEEEGQFQPGRCSKWWFKQSLIKFQLQIAALGSRLILRRSTDSVQELLSVVKETKATSVHFNHLFDPISLVRDHSAKQLLGECGVTCRSYNADLLYDPWDVLDQQGEPFTSFRSFWDRWARTCLNADVG